MLSIDLSIIIINYKSAHHILTCIESIYKETHQYSFEIIVVDNDSGDDSEEKIRTAYPAIKWFQSDYRFASAPFSHRITCCIRCWLKFKFNHVMP